MTYLSLEKVVEARSYIEKNIKKPDTFVGLILFLLCIVERKRNGSYLKADMKRFSEMADDAFYLSDINTAYSDKYWFALLTNDWIDQVKEYFLKGNKVSAKKVMYSLFWGGSFGELQSKMALVSRDVYENLFIDDLTESDFYESKPISRKDLLSSYDNVQGASTLKFDGTFVKKKAGDLNGAPFGQTLYAATEIKKIISIYDFDFIEKFDLSDNNYSMKLRSDLGMQCIKEEFRLWLIEQGLSDRTASSYSGAGISLSDKYLDSLGINVKSLYQLNAEQVSTVADRLRGIDDWFQADERGNSMYSSACKRLAEFLASIEATELSKPFLLLAGISGTGKTRFVREQAAASKRGRGDNYCLVPVRPDWHEPSDLLGYVSRLGEKPEYVATDVLRFIVQAWKEVIDEIEFDKGLPFDWRGKSLNDIRPFWLCLDEMNLAPVEQYFSDYLSILETRCWNDPKTLEGSDRDYIYECDPLIKGELFRALDKDIDVGEDSKPSELLAKDLGLDLSKPLEKGIWQYFLTHGIAIPFNLIVAGTVNMDETTHGFSRKVIDRALTFDFGEFFPNDMDAFFVSDVKAKTLSYPIHSQATMALFESVEADSDASKTKTFFNAVNGVLKNTPFELAFRAFNELCLSVISFAPKNDVELAAVFDDFLMCKVLPRIEGDEDKLTSKSGDNVLLQLSTTLETQLATIWKTTRPDLLREKQGGPEHVLTTPCRSRPKIERMQKQLTNGFTSFWP